MALALNFLCQINITEDDGCKIQTACIILFTLRLDCDCLADKISDWGLRTENKASCHFFFRLLNLIDTENFSSQRYKSVSLQAVILSSVVKQSFNSLQICTEVIKQLFKIGSKLSLINGRLRNAYIEWVPPYNNNIQVSIVEGKIVIFRITSRAAVTPDITTQCDMGRLGRGN